MKRKFLSVLLCVGMTSALLAGCGGSGGSGSATNDGAAQSVAAGESTSAQESGAVSEVSDAASGAADDSRSEADGESGAESAAENVDSGDAADVGASGEDAGTEEGSDAEAELNAYGLTDEQQEALLSSVKAAITEDYLEKYGIAAADFYVNPYDEADLANYANYVYTGTDTYEWASLWSTINTCIIRAKVGDSDLYTMWASYAYSDGAYSDTYYEKMEAAGKIFADTFPEQWENVVEGGTVEESQSADLIGAVYRGIAEFLNSVDPRECASILGNLCWVWRTNDNTTLFDRVLSENLQFE